MKNLNETLTNIKETAQSARSLSIWTSTENITTLTIQEQNKATQYIKGAIKDLKQLLAEVEDKGNPYDNKIDY